MQTNPILLGWAIFLLAGLPALAARDASRAPPEEQLAAHRRAIYVSIALSLGLVAAATWGVAVWQGLPAGELGWRVEEAAAAGLWAVVTAGAGLLLAWGMTALGRRLGLREGRLPRLLMPRTGPEKAAFLLMVGVAAVCEEYIFRGFLLSLLTTWTGSGPAAVALTSVSFGLAHGYQRVPGVVRATLLGGVLAAPVVWTGSLFPAIVAHFWINAAIGLGGWRWLLPEEEIDGDGAPRGEGEGR